MPCVTCGTTLPVERGSMTWCHACGWNLTAPARPDRAETRTARISDAIGRRLGDRLATELLRAPALEPRWTPAKVAAYVIAALVHVTVLALAVGGLALAALAFPNPAALVAAALMLGLALLM